MMFQSLISLLQGDLTVLMMMLSNGNIFHITGPLWGPFVMGIHWLPVVSHHKGQWCGALMFALICAWINTWANYQEASDLRCHHAHYEVTVKWYLTHWGLVMHICVKEMGQYKFWWWLVTCSLATLYDQVMMTHGVRKLDDHWLWLVVCLAWSVYLKQWGHIVNWSLRNNLQWNLCQNTIIFIQEHAFGYVVCKISAIMLRPQGVNL